VPVTHPAPTVGHAFHRGAATAALILCGVLTLAGCSSNTSHAAASGTTHASNPGPLASANPATRVATTTAASGAAAEPFYTNPAGTPVPFGSAAPFRLETYQSNWQDSTLVAYLTRTGGGSLTSTPETSGGKPQGTLLSRDWTNSQDNLKYSASIDRNTAGQIVIIQCYVSGSKLADSTGFLQNCLGDCVISDQSENAEHWVAIQAAALTKDIANSPNLSFTSPQPAFGATRAVIRSTMNLAEHPAVPTLVLYITAATPSSNGQH
jgi:hypothetical protein